jgi:hypothetical protein
MANPFLQFVKPEKEQNPFLQFVTQEKSEEQLSEQPPASVVEAAPTAENPFFYFCRSS